MLKEKIPEAMKGQTRTKAGKIAGVNDRYVQDAKGIQEKYPHLAKKVFAGEMSIQEAKRAIMILSPQKTFHKKDYLKDNPLSAPITAELTSFQLRLAEYTNLITKQSFLDSRTRGDIEPLIRALLELCKDAAERAMRLRTALEKVAAA